MGYKTGSLRRIPDEMRQVIFDWALRDKKEKREDVANELDKYFGEHYGEKVPSHETILRIITEARKQELDEKDELWNIGACVKYPIQSDIIYALLLERSNFDLPGVPLMPWDIRYGWNANSADENSEWLSYPLRPTIRWALWFARLYPVVGRLLRKQEHVVDERHSLYTAIFASQYARRELVAEMMAKSQTSSKSSHKTLDTSDIDRDLLGLNVKGDFEKTLADWKRVHEGEDK